MIAWLLSHTAHVIGGLGGILVTIITQRGLRFLARYRVTKNGEVVDRSIALSLTGRAEDSPTPRQRPPR